MRTYAEWKENGPVNPTDSYCRLTRRNRTEIMANYVALSAATSANGHRRRRSADPRPTGLTSKATTLLRLRRGGRHPPPRARLATMTMMSAPPVLSLLASSEVSWAMGHDENEDEGDAPVDRATTNYELPYFLPRTTRRVPNIWYERVERQRADDVSLGGGDGGGARGARSRGSGGT